MLNHSFIDESKHLREIFVSSPYISSFHLIFHKAFASDDMLIPSHDLFQYPVPNSTFVSTFFDYDCSSPGWGLYKAVVAPVDLQLDKWQVVLSVDDDDKKKDISCIIVIVFFFFQRISHVAMLALATISVPSSIVELAW